MDVRTCKVCGTLFNYVSGLPLCTACMKEIDDKFPQVKQYIYENPGVGIQQVSEENKIPIAIIKKWVKEERLSFTEGSSIAVECERCGRMILSGRYCDECKSIVTKQLGSVYKGPESSAQKKPAKDKAKMRFIN